MFEGRMTYRPFKYMWAYDLWHAHSSISWHPDEVVFEQDVKDWNLVLTDSEKRFLTRLLQFFTQADVQVNAAYAGIFLPVFHKTPELNLICSDITGREGTHVVSYSRANDTLNMPDEDYGLFMQFEAMASKYDYVSQFKNDSPYELAKACAVYGAFVEGIQLFSSFAMLMNFDRFGKMPGMVDIARWSQRDEKYHCEFLIQCYHTLLQEFPELNTKEFKAEIREIGLKMVELEEHFVELVFNEGVPEGLNKDEMIQYVRFLGDTRLTQLKLKTEFKIKKNPLPWVDVIVNGKEHANFFERRSMEYSKGQIKGQLNDDDWGDVF